MGSSEDLKNKSHFDKKMRQALILSLIDLICCCTPMGIAALIFLWLASNENEPDKQQKKISHALSANYIGFFIGFIFQYIYLLPYYLLFLKN